MAKKRGKTKVKTISKKKIKKSKAAKKSLAKKLQVSEPLKDALSSLEILGEEKKIEGKINGVEKKEEEIVAEEKKIEKETEKIESIEKDIKEEITVKPLTKFSMKDLNKGIIGAFIGIVAHYSFFYGRQIAADITISRATVLLIFSYLLIIILMYETGYRQIKEKRLLMILPKRATIIYLTSIVIILLVFALFNQINLADLAGLYRQVAVTSILASVGAGTADLIGRD